MASIKKSKAMAERYKAQVKASKAIEKTVRAEERLIKTKLKARKAAKKQRGETFKKIAGAYGYSTKLSQSLLAIGSGFAKQPQTSAGRPKKIYKHTSPLSGKPVPAEVYYAHMRQFKNIQARRVEDANERQIAEYAKRGISPQQAAQIQERIRQQRLLEEIQRKMKPQVQQQAQIQSQVQQLQQQPEQYHNQQRQAEQLPEGTRVDASTRVWKNRYGVVETDWTAFGRRKIIRGLPFS